MFTHCLYSGFGFSRWLLVAGGLAAGIFCCARGEEPATPAQEEPRKASALEAHEEMTACMARLKVARERLQSYRAGVVATNEVLLALEAEVHAGGEGAQKALAKMKELFDADPQGAALAEVLTRELVVLREIQKKAERPAPEGEAMEAGAKPPRIENLRSAPGGREPNRRLQPSSSAATLERKPVLNKQHEEVRNENE